MGPRRPLRPAHHHQPGDHAHCRRRQGLRLPADLQRDRDAAVRRERRALRGLAGQDERRLEVQETPLSHVPHVQARHAAGDGRALPGQEIGDAMRKTLVALVCGVAIAAGGFSWKFVSAAESKTKLTTQDYFDIYNLYGIYTRYTDMGY